MVAFESLLASNSYRRTNKSSSQDLPQDHTVRHTSAKVYTTMFRRYLNFLSQRNTNFTAARPSDIESFINGNLDGTAHATRQRYARLLERAYAEAVDVGVLVTNPVSAMLARKPVEGQKAATPYRVDQVEVVVLQQWLADRAAAILHNDGPDVDWHQARDITMAAISLGAGLRCAELTALELPQIKHWAGGPPEYRYEFFVPTRRSVSTSRDHLTKANPECVEVFDSWLSFRRGRLPAILRKDSESLLVFPSGIPGRQLKTQSIYSYFKVLCEAAVEEGALEERSSWILGTGARGLRRAYIMSSLKQGKDADLLTERLGHFEARSIRRYSERLAAEQGVQLQAF